MKDNIKLLMEETGCDQGEAELALTLSDNNLEKAITKIGILLKFITAFKVKLIFPLENIYGLMHIAVNMKNAEILRFSVVASHNPAVYENSAKMDWFSFEKAIFSYRLDTGAMENYTQSIEEKLKSHIAKELKQLPVISNDEISKIILSFFEPVLVKTEITGEELNLSQFKKLPDYNTKQNEFSFTGYDLGFVKLGVEILEDLNGKPAEKLSEGDIVLSLITDERDIAHYLAHLIGGRKDGNMIPLPAMVKKIASKNEDFEIHLHYAPSITGLAKIGRGALLKVLETKNQPWWRKIMPW
jgi:UBA/TS-N domain.